VKRVRFLRLDGRAATARALSAALLVALAPLAACSSTDFDGQVEGARREGVYPNLNIPPQSAAPVHTPAEAASDRAGLTALKDVVVAEGATPPESQRARLEELGATHGQKAIDEIEGKPAQ
jgi:hypothetical protein